MKVRLVVYMSWPPMVRQAPASKHGASRHEVFSVAFFDCTHLQSLLVEPSPRGVPYPREPNNNSIFHGWYVQDDLDSWFASSPS